MIHALSLNAALAESVWFREPTGSVERDLPMDFGGPSVACKAVNAFRTIQALEPGRHRLLISLGGERGQRIAHLLGADGVPHEPLPRTAENRRTLVIFRRRRGAGYDSWEWKGEARLSASELAALVDRVSHVALRGTLVLVSGTPPALPREFSWSPLFDALGAAGARVVLDSSQWRAVMAGGFAPWVLKINRAEWGRGAPTQRLLVSQMQRLARRRSMHAVIVTDGRRGAHVATADAAWRVWLEPREGVVYPIGSGDAFAGGLCVALDRGESIEKALELATLCAFENLSSPQPGEVDPARFKHWAKRVKVRRLAG